MGDLQRPVKPVPATGKELSEGVRRVRENVARIDAVSRAEELGRAAALSGECPIEAPPVDPEQFGTQMRRLDVLVEGIPRLDMPAEVEDRLRRESGQLRAALDEAERSELLSESASANGDEATV
jgi:hypothetical protein